jgi:NADH-quinone oxidoreductase subunit J
MTGIGTTIAFWVFAVAAVGLSIAAISARHPLRSAFFLVGVFMVTAALFLLLDARLVAILQVLVYAGAIMVFIIFVIMLINLRPEQLGSRKVTLSKAAALIIGVGLGVSALRVGYQAISAKPVPEGFGQVESVSTALYTRFAFAFEAVSVLLLVAIIGAVVLAGKKDQEKKG